MEGPIRAIIEARDKGATSANCLILRPYRHQKVKPAGAGKTDHVRGIYRLGPHHAALMNSLGDTLKAADQHAKAETKGSADIFGVLAEEPEQIEQSYASCQPWPGQVV